MTDEIIALLYRLRQDQDAYAIGDDGDAELSGLLKWAADTIEELAAHALQQTHSAAQTTVIEMNQRGDYRWFHD